MLIEEEINRFLRNIVDEILGIPGYMIAAKQNAPRPRGAYGNCDLISLVSVGWDTRQTEDVEGDRVRISTEGIRKGTFSIGFYREQAIDNGIKVQSGLVRETILGKMKAANIGLVSKADVRELSEALDSEWEERAQLDIELNLIGSDEDIVEAITAISIGGEVQYPPSTRIPIDVEVIS